MPHLHFWTGSFDWFIDNAYKEEHQIEMETSMLVLFQKNILRGARNRQFFIPFFSCFWQFKKARSKNQATETYAGSFFVVWWLTDVWVWPTSKPIIRPYSIRKPLVLVVLFSSCDNMMCCACTHYNGQVRSEIVVTLVGESECNSCVGEMKQ